MTSFNVISIEQNHQDSQGDLVTMNMVYRPGWLGRLLGKQPRQEQARFIGSGTLWCRYPNLEPIRGGFELTLSHIWRRWMAGVAKQEAGR